MRLRIYTPHVPVGKTPRGQDVRVCLIKDHVETLLENITAFEISCDARSKRVTATLTFAEVELDVVAELAAWDATERLRGTNDET